MEKHLTSFIEIKVLILRCNSTLVNLTTKQVETLIEVLGDLDPKLKVM
jgi:hypothetical protein